METALDGPPGGTAHPLLPRLGMPISIDGLDGVAWVAFGGTAIAQTVPPTPTETKSSTGLNAPLRA
jgi:hypothetical protein